MADEIGIAYPKQLAAAECAEIERRRAAARFYDYPDTGTQQPPAANGLPPDTVGVALSGGGIRSATFCLGVFRALARQRLLHRIDLLSTVSGGGYFGSFLGGLFVPRDQDGKPYRRAVAEVEDQLLDLHSQSSDWLRENGRYMAPNGAGDAMLAGAILLRNWLATLLVVCSLLFTLLAGTAWLAGTGVLEWTAHQTVSLLPIARDWTGYSAVSPFLTLPLGLLVLAVIPLGWAFWFTQKGRVPLIFALALLVLALAVPSWGATPWARLLAFEAVLALVAWGAAVVHSRMRAERGAGARLQRNDLSRWLSVALWSACALLAFGLVDSLGYVLAMGSWQFWAPVAAAAAALPTAFGWMQKAAPLLGGRRAAGVLARPMLLAGVAAFLVASTLVVALCTAAYAAGDYRGWAFLVGAVVTLLGARTVSFLNLSSHNSLYGARLTRAYLGASNERRHAQHGTITEIVPGDAIAMADYDLPAAGGPLHLINVTLNETVLGKSQIEQRDRKGLGMTVGPCGLSVGRRHHALWRSRERRELDPVPGARREDFLIFTPPRDKPLAPEELDLGDWVSISGAAFTTGLGTRTSLSLSLLLGLANVRLGYWWRSGTDPARCYQVIQEREPPKARVGRWLSSLLPVHTYLLDELLARFHGPGRARWYLSDGGHSENTGAFELIRRRVPFIVICDCGCDPHSEFEDLANLARRARVDLDAELSVFTREHLDRVLPPALRPCFGTIEDFAPSHTARPHALLAGVFYADPLRARQPGSVILLLKPSLGGDEPADVGEYGARHQAFPNETTIDQFFDEAQWESYRRLGEHVASRVFEDVPGAWRPLDLCPPPLARMHWRGAARSLGAPQH